MSVVGEDTDVRITPPTAGDAEQLALVHVQCWREAYGRLLPERFYGDEARERRLAMWQRVLSGPDALDRVRVARHSEGLVGFAVRGPARDDPDHPAVREHELYGIYLLAGRHGTGVGQALLDACLGDRPAQLWVARDNPRARRFYERNGFAPDGTEKADPELDGLAEVRMVR